MTTSPAMPAGEHGSRRETDQRKPFTFRDTLATDEITSCIRLGRAYGCVMGKMSSARSAMLWFVLLAGCQSVSCDVRLGDTDFAAARERMVNQQLAARGRDITNARVLSVMGKVPRHEFVPERMRAQAYGDYPLPIGYDQTISQPYIVAFMTEKLEPKPTDKVLEIGTGSGYQAAVLAGLVSNVFTIEIVEPLARRAETDLKRLGYTNIVVRVGDGYKGWLEAAPFDAIIVTCAPERVPQPLVDQLKEGGRMIIPVGRAGDQELYLLQKKEGRVEKHAVLPVRFVPMTGGPANRR